MDLPQIQALTRPKTRTDLAWHPGQAYLAGGTWLFSEPQPGTTHLIDLATLNWPPLEHTDGLRIAATCTIAELERYPHPLFSPVCNALLGSFKVQSQATVGGNVCLALPAAPMLALTVALEGTALIWRPDGTERRLPMAEFATGPQRTALQPGDLLRAIDLPAAALARRSAMRQASLHEHGRSAALLIATYGEATTLTVTASTPHPVHFSWAQPPSEHEITARLDSLTYYDDIHGTPAWRRHMTRRLALELLA